MKKFNLITIAMLLLFVAYQILTGKLIPNEIATPVLIAGLVTIVDFGRNIIRGKRVI